MIYFTDWNTRINEVKQIINPKIILAAYCDLTTFATALVKWSPASKFWYCKNVAVDVFDKNEQSKIVHAEYNRAYRVAREHVKQILDDYFFPKVS